MKKVTVLVSVFMFTAIMLKAQCDKAIKWTSLKSEFLDTAGNLQQSREEKVEVTTTPQKISIIIHDDSQEKHMEGNVSNYSCNWKNKQNGKMTFNSLLVDTDENKTRHASCTIEALNGKTTLILRAQEEATVIRLNIDSSEEVK